VKRLPSQSIEDFKLAEDCYKPDFEISERFEKFAIEIERLSLLGIGAYGFFLTTFAFDKGHSTPYLDQLKSHPLLLGFGVIVFAFAAALALYSTYLSSECLGCQLDIVRMFNRLESHRWKPDEQQVNRDFAIDRQGAQKRIFRRNQLALGSAAILLGSGACAIAWTFAWVIFKVK
jgi:hypothetical protein